MAKNHHLVIRIYEITKNFPTEEKYGLVQQMCPAAVSIPANIVEGFKKQGIKNKLNAYNISQGSLEELRYYLILSKDLNYLPDFQSIWDISEEVSRMLIGLIKSIKSKIV
ncbi:MAG: four helix bundle protein [bacterium]